MRSRSRLRRHRSLPGPGLQPPQRPRARRRVHRQRTGASRRPPLGRGAGRRRRQHEPLDDEAPVRRRAARARGHRLLPPDAPGRLGSQHARRELSLALLLRDLRGEPRSAGPPPFLLNPETAGRVLRARDRRRRRLAGRELDPLHRQQLRDPSHGRHLRAHPQQAPRADSLPGEEPPPPDGGERAGRRMSESDSRELTAAVAAGAPPAEEQHRTLLGSIVEVARAIFTARAASIFLLDESADELVFEAVAGGGADTLVGTRFPSSTGIAGGVLVTRQPLVIDDLSQDPRFARDVAESLGYVPRALMAVPLLHGERALGVLEVLDRVRGSRFALEEMELLGLFGSQAAIALELLQRARRAGAVLAEADEEITTVAHLTRALDSLAGERREAGLRLLRALEEVLRER